jgi:SNF2 family DNA or RNA helicase
MFNVETYKNLRLIDTVYKNACTAESPSMGGEEFPKLKVPLHAHQKSIIKAMENYEYMLTKGTYSISGEQLYSNYGILGDTVGIGKSLMVLGHISRLDKIDPIDTIKKVGAGAQHSMFSIYEKEHTTKKLANSLILVPHTLFRQWSNYIKQQTHLKTLYLEKKKMLEAETFQDDILAADIVLVSNTLYREFSAWQENRDISWRRFFIDEADSIHIVSTSFYPQTRFTWLITASWINLMYPNILIRSSNQVLQDEVYSEGGEFRHLRELVDSWEPFRGNNFSYMRYSVLSHGFLVRNILSSFHKERSHLVLTCDKEYVAESISLPPVYRRTILCRAPVNHRIIENVISPEVRERLHGGDVAGALELLGVQTEDTRHLVDIVTEKLKKDLHVVEATYAFKASLDYSSPHAKEIALASLEAKKAAIQEQITTLQNRIEKFKEEVCPICYSDLEEPLLSPCCSQFFCGNCIVQWLDRKTTCPMCRAGLKCSELKKVVTVEERNAIVESGSSAGEGADADADQVPALEKKSEALLRIFRENPDGRFLVFSRYDYPFTAIERELQEMNWSVKILKGNKNAIQSSLNQFEKGDLRCLLLNSAYAGAGLTITAATHVILFHAMTHEEEKQVIGRACRMGRTESLQCIKLVHEGEMTT